MVSSSDLTPAPPSNRMDIDGDGSPAVSSRTTRSGRDYPVPREEDGDDDDMDLSEAGDDEDDANFGAGE